MTNTLSPADKTYLPPQTTLLPSPSQSEKSTEGFSNIGLLQQLDEEQLEFSKQLIILGRKIERTLGALDQQKKVLEMSNTNLTQQISQLRTTHISQLHANNATFIATIKGVTATAINIFDQFEENRQKCGFDFPQLKEDLKKAFLTTIEQIKTDHLEVYPEYKKIKATTVIQEITTVSSDLVAIERFVQTAPEDMQDEIIQDYKSLKKQVDALSLENLHLLEQKQMMADFHASFSLVFHKEEKQKISAIILQRINAIYDSVNWNWAIPLNHKRFDGLTPTTAERHQMRCQLQWKEKLDEQQISLDLLKATISKMAS